MNEINFKRYYTKSLQGHEGQYHFAAHSHHLWPDVSEVGHQEAWNDAAMSSDKKWDKIFGTIIPEVQALIGEILHLKNPERIVFAPNTHELLNRVISLFPTDSELNILTTNSEFYSFSRQITRLEENNKTKVTRLKTDTVFENRQKWVDDFIQEMKSQKYHLIFLSQVFFDSGFAFTQKELEQIVNEKPEESLFILDGYHGFCALPYDLSNLEGKIFFLAGGYKYAQAGEGVCFMLVPKGQWRPANTGWFANFMTLHQTASEKVNYAEDANAFWGGTFDPTGLYRFRAVWTFFKKEGITVQRIHDHVKFLQTGIIRNSDPVHTKLLLDEENLLDWHGHFFTYLAPNEEVANSVSTELFARKILHDRRGLRIRIGLGLYQSDEELIYLLRNLCL